MYKKSILNRLLVVVLVMALLPSFHVWAGEEASEAPEQAESGSSDSDMESEEVQKGQDNQPIHGSENHEDEMDERESPSAVLETKEVSEEPVGGEFEISAAFSPAKRLDNGKWKIEKGVTCTATIRIKNVSATDWENANVYGGLNIPDLANYSSEITYFQFMEQEGVTVSDWRSDGPPPNHKDAQAKIASLAAGESITLTAVFVTSVLSKNEAEIHIRSEIEPGSPELGQVNYDVTLYNKLGLSASFSPAENLGNGKWKIQRGIRCNAVIYVKNNSTSDWEDVIVSGQIFNPDEDTDYAARSLAFKPQEGITVSGYSDGPEPAHNSAQAKIAHLAAGESITLNAVLLITTDMADTQEIRLKSYLDSGEELGEARYDVTLFDKNSAGSGVNTPSAVSANKKQTGAKTGDTSNTLLYLILGLAGIAGIYGITSKKQISGR